MKKIAIITGATGGIGLACVKVLVNRGYHVIATGTREHFEPMESVTYVRSSIAVAEDRQRVLEAALELGERVDVLVNVAGVAPLVRNDILDMTEESYDRVMDINTKGVFFMTQLVARNMAEHAVDGEMNGSIVNISSMSAYTSSNIIKKGKGEMRVVNPGRMTGTLQIQEGAVRVSKNTDYLNGTKATTISGTKSW